MERGRYTETVPSSLCVSVILLTAAALRRIFSLRPEYSPAPADWNRSSRAVLQSLLCAAASQGKPDRPRRTSRHFYKPGKRAPVWPPVRCPCASGDLAGMQHPGKSGDQGENKQDV